MSSVQIVVLVLASALGATGAWILRNKTHSEFLSVLLSFSGAYLLGAVVLHLLPEIFVTGADIHEHDYSTAIFILVGFFIQLVIVQFTKGIEHGHLHLHEHFSKSYVAGVVFGLGIHAFMEGIPLSLPDIDPKQVEPLFWGIAVHKIPETFALATVLFFSFKKHYIALSILGVFALLTPMGSFTGRYLAESTTQFNWLVAVVCGSLIHISTTIIFEASGKAHRISIFKLGAIICGFAISLISLLLE